MVSEDRFQALRAKTAEPVPETFKFADVDDELFGNVVSLSQAPYKNDMKWFLVVDGATVTSDGQADGLWKTMLNKHAVDQLVAQRDVRAGDGISIRLKVISGSSGFHVYTVAVDPDRPRTAPVAAEDPWFDEDGNRMPEPPDDDPGF